MEYKASFDSYILNNDQSGAIMYVCITFNFPFLKCWLHLNTSLLISNAFLIACYISRTYFSCTHNTVPVEPLLAIVLAPYSTHFLEISILLSTSIRPTFSDSA